MIVFLTFIVSDALSLECAGALDQALYNHNGAVWAVTGVPTSIVQRK